jgi:hypothetical protein
MFEVALTFHYNPLSFLYLVLFKNTKYNATPDSASLIFFTTVLGGIECGGKSKCCITENFCSQTYGRKVRVTLNWGLSIQ